MKTSSRTPLVDRELCVKNAGGSQFELVLLAAARARQLMREEQADHAPITALLEIQQNKL